MIAGETYGEIGLGIGDRGGLDAVDRQLLDEDVGRLGHHRDRTLRELRREQEGDRAAIAVTDQDRPLDARLVEHRRQEQQGLVVEVARVARAIQGLRLAMAPTIIDEPRQAQAPT